MCLRISVLTTRGSFVGDKRRVAMGIPNYRTNSLGVIDLIIGTAPCDGIGGYSSGKRQVWKVAYN